MFKLILSAALALSTIFISSSAHAQWTSPKEIFGQDWTCNRMSAGNPLYDICKRCDDDTSQFYWMEPGRTSGKCMPREGSSRRQQAEPDTPSTPAVRQRPSPSYENASPRPKPPLSADEKDWRWVAIVFSGDRWGSAKNYPSEEMAIRDARRECGAANCTAEAAFVDGCVSLYRYRNRFSDGSERSGFMSGAGDTQEEAKRGVFNRCSAKHQTCGHEVTVCSR